jgi:hypothetical protein
MHRSTDLQLPVQALHKKYKTLTEPLVPKISTFQGSNSGPESLFTPRAATRIPIRPRPHTPNLRRQTKDPVSNKRPCAAPTGEFRCLHFADRLTACSSNFPLPQVLVKPIPAFLSPAIFTSSPSSVLFFLLRRRRSTFTPKISTKFVNHTSPTCTG